MNCFYLVQECNDFEKEFKQSNIIEKGLPSVKNSIEKYSFF